MIDLKAFKRSYLTEHFTDFVKLSGFAVGDAEAPDEGGWDGPPDGAESSYAPYVVVVPGTAGDASGPIGASIADIQANFIVTGYGLSRSHVENYMDSIADVLVAMDRTMVVMGESQWKVQQVRRDSIGGISRNDSIEPSEFSQSDVYVVYISKEL